MQRFFIIFLFLIIAGTGLASAATVDFNPSSPPCITPNALGPCQPTTDIASYINRLYQFAVGVSGLLAVGMIVWGAILRIVSGGAPDKIREGNDMIVSALWGIALLFGSYLILKTVNPRIVQLQQPNAPQAPTVQYTAISTSSPFSASCSGSNPYGCFIDSNGNPLDFQDPSQVGTAINTGTAGCTSANRPSDCICTNCGNVARNIYSVPFPLKSGNSCADTGQPGLGVCFLEENFQMNFERYLFDVQNSIPLGNTATGWRITEAFPPVALHIDPCHYDGTCLDFARQLDPAFPPDAQFCAQILTAATTAANDGFSVSIEGLTDGFCPNIAGGHSGSVQNGVIRKSYSTTTGFHLHIR